VTAGEVHVEPVAIARLAALLGSERAERFTSTADRTREALAGRRVVNVNSTAAGGGVAELLQTLLAYSRGAGVDARWFVIDGDPAFFEITKRIHNRLYGSAGDAGSLDAVARRHYEATAERNAGLIDAVVRPGDIVLIHDPQTAPLAHHAQRAGATVIWRCHIGLDQPNEHSEQAWEFLAPYLEDLDGYVFSRAQFVPPQIPLDRVAVIAPSIDPFSAKNDLIEPALVTRVLVQAGVLADGAGGPVSFVRRDGSRGATTHRVDLLDTGPPPAPSVPVVLQASRWDTLKDMRGVMVGFADLVAPYTNAHLVLAGPEPRGVADDPEAALVLRDCRERWAGFPEPIRARVHLACVPMEDADEAATIVNALQRHAAVVVQKSLAEGFGLTVAEAMWKERAVVGGAVGGIVDQILDGVTGFLVDAHDLEQYARSVRALLDDVPLARTMGVAAHARVRDQFLGDRHLEQWAALFERLDGS
jgi:trehalose synthase